MKKENSKARERLGCIAKEAFSRMIKDVPLILIKSFPFKYI